MKIKTKLATLAATALMSLPSSATVTYAYSNIFDSGTFALSVPDFIRTDTFIPVSDMTECTMPLGSCVGVRFYSDAAADGLAPDHPDWEALALISSRTGGRIYYFELPAFLQPGTYQSVFTSGARLGVSVSAIPEASPFACLLLGLGFVGGVAHKRDRRTTKSAA